MQSFNAMLGLQDLERRVNAGLPDALATMLRTQYLMLKRNKLTSSIAIGDAVLTLHPDNQDAMNWKSQALIMLKEIPERAKARDILERLVEINPGHLEGMVNLATIYLTIGPISKAPAMVDRLLSMQPNDPLFKSMKMEAQGRLAEEVTVEEREPAKPAAAGDGGAEGEAAQEPRTRMRKIQRARYPADVTDFDDLKGAIKKHVLAGEYGGAPFLGQGSRGFTMGSCFAGRIGRELQRLGWDTFHMQLAETVNTTYANLAFMRWIAGDAGLAEAAYFDQEVRKGGFTREKVVESLKAADFLVYTLGVAPAFFHKETGAFTLHSTSDFKQFEFLRDYAYRTTTTGENVANLEKILGLAREMNPKIRFILSVSPVPLSATFEFPSAVQADCISKSVQRVAAFEFVKDKDDGVIYWPSFEIVRWLGGHIGRVFGSDDGSNHHVDDALVGTIVELFIERFSAKEAAAAA
jgi:tetratricopeptide (TPR) repeat protein